MVTATVAIPAGSEQTYEQKMTVSQPKLWSLEDRNLYTLVTEVRVGGDVVDRYETHFWHSLHQDRCPERACCSTASRSK